MFGSAKDKLARPKHLCETYVRIERRPDTPAGEGRLLGPYQRTYHQRDENLHRCQPPRLGFWSRSRFGWPIWECAECNDIWMVWQTVSGYWHRLTPFSCDHFDGYLSGEANVAKNRALSYYRHRGGTQD